MSNVNSPFGFMPLGTNRGGAPWSGAVIEKKLASGNNTAICKGDVVQQLSTGYVAISAPSVVGSLTTGIFWGCKYLSTSQGRVIFSNYWPNGDHAVDGTAFIIPIAGVPAQLFKVQALSTNFTFADIGANCDLSVGSQTIVGGFGTSGMTLDRSTIGTTNTLPFRVVDLYSNVLGSTAQNGTDDTSNYNIVIVQSNPDVETGIN